MAFHQRRGEVHADDVAMFAELSQTKFGDEPDSFENQEPIMDLTNLDDDWNA